MEAVRPKCPATHLILTPPPYAHPLLPLRPGREEELGSLRRVTFPEAASIPPRGPQWTWVLILHGRDEKPRSLQLLSFLSKHFLLGLGLERKGDRQSPGGLPAQWILELPTWPPAMSFEWVVGMVMGAESPGPSEGHSVGAISLCPYPPILFFLRLRSSLHHR